MTANLHPLEGSKPAASIDPTAPAVDPTTDRAGDALRDLAVQRLKKKADFRTHLLIFVLVNAMVVLVWAMTGAHFFWPVFLMGGWGIGLVSHAVDVYGRTVPTEDDILREMDRLRRR